MRARDSIAAHFDKLVAMGAPRLSRTPVLPIPKRFVPETATPASAPTHRGLRLPVINLARSKKKTKGTNRAKKTVSNAVFRGGPEGACSPIATTCLGEGRRLGKLAKNGTIVARDGPGQPAGGPGGAIGFRLLRWQDEGDVDAFDSLVQSILPILEGLAGRMLRRHGIADTSAVDDAVSLVLDHLRRLRGAGDDEPSVARFLPDPLRSGRGTPGDRGHDREPADTGMAYVCWLIRDRAADVARGRRREARRAIPLSELHAPPDRPVHRPSSHTGPGAADIDDVAERAASLQEAIALLEPRLRTVTEMLLDGKSQASIAKTLNVCEGTVSRLRRRAILELRRLVGR